MTAKGTAGVVDLKFLAIVAALVAGTSNPNHARTYRLGSIALIGKFALEQAANSSKFPNRDT
jgi:hypothetical protein